jgi:erythromycin esterase
MRRLAIAVTCLALAGLAPASGDASLLPAKNLAFDKWDEARGWPEGWGGVRSKHFVVERDCEVKREGRCTLRVAGGEGAPPGDFQPLGQSIAPGPAAGHYLRVSGWIRTAGVVEGWAGLWGRTDVEGKSVALENMRTGGPRGTTGWRRFDIRVPVASNATMISYGVLLTGRGSAWFDGLEVAVDDSERVGAVAKTQVVDPPRPPVSPRLMDDAALALTPSQMPPVREHWREEARRVAQPLRSLTSDDFSDLQFLKPLLAGRRVVQLGESSHGVAEFNWLKVRLVKFLHREMGFDVVAFESSLAGCDVADSMVGVATATDVMRTCVFPVWHSSETLGLFEYLDEARAAGQRIALAGFDTQDSSQAARVEVSARLVRQVARVDAELARRIREHEARLAPHLDPELAREMRRDYSQAVERLGRDREALRKLEGARPLEVDIAIQQARSRERYAGQLAGSREEATRLRDEGMADNLDFLLGTMYPGRKVIVWAHNFHVVKEPSGHWSRAMGSWVAERRGAEVYTIGLYMGRGAATLNNRSRYAIAPPDPDSFEAILASAGWRAAFVDLSDPRAPADSWRRMPLRARDSGTTPMTLTPARAYDGVIYIDTVTPPEYL